MGCGGSKLDDLEAVALCRDRTHLLEAAIRHRYSLAQAHLAYLHSVRSFASSLHHFFSLELDSASPPSLFLPLPTQRKGDPSPFPGLAAQSPDLIKPSPSSPVASAHHSPTNSGSHLHFHSDSDSEGSGSPLHDHEALPYSPTRYHMNYARSEAPAPSVTYEQRPQSPETVYFGGSGYPYAAYANANPSSSYSYQYPYSNHGEMRELFGSSGPYSYSSPPGPPVAAARAESSSKEEDPPPPPPPPPAASSGWDFLNPFESVTEYYRAYTPSRNSKELREEEGIPDLEDEYQQEVVKEAYGEQKFVAVDGESRGIGGDLAYGMRSSAVGESSGAEYGLHLVDKNVVPNVESQVESRGNAAPVNARGPLGVSKAVYEIKVQFERVSDSGGEVSKILEVGKLPYRGKNAVYKVSSRMLDVITPLSAVTSQPSTSRSTEALPSPQLVDPLSMDFEESKGLSSTLQQLYIWEKKLYEEIKVEERLRVRHERKCRQLKGLDEEGAEAHKIESNRTLVRKLSTKIRIAFQFVDSISNKINKLRDEDLWPQLDQLIQGLVRMWKIMLECHQIQCQIITEAGNLDAVAASRKLGDAHMNAAMQLEQDLLDWILSFYALISSQKSFVKALNEWLFKCIHYEPELTPDGIVPFSPGRIGAPPVFVICHQWFQVLDRIEVNEVFEAMRAFSECVLQLWDQYNLEQRQGPMASKEMDKGLKSLEGEQQKMQKALDTVNKKLALVSEQNGLTPPGQIVHHIGSSQKPKMQSGLKRIFESMERFSNVCVKTYDELRLRCEQDRLARENAKVP